MSLSQELYHTIEQLHTGDIKYEELQKQFSLSIKKYHSCHLTPEELRWFCLQLIDLYGKGISNTTKAADGVLTALIIISKETILTDDYKLKLIPLYILAVKILYLGRDDINNTSNSLFNMSRYRQIQTLMTLNGKTKDEVLGAWGTISARTYSHMYRVIQEEIHNRINSLANNVVSTPYINMYNTQIQVFNHILRGI